MATERTCLRVCAFACLVPVCVHVKQSEEERKRETAQECVCLSLSLSLSLSLFLSLSFSVSVSVSVCCLLFLTCALSHASHSQGANVETVCKEQGWKVSGSDIIIPVGEYNHASSKDMSNPVTFEKDIAPIVVASSGL